jgi:hypothetical protein
MLVNPLPLPILKLPFKSRLNNVSGRTPFFFGASEVFCANN